MPLWLWLTGGAIVTGFAGYAGFLLAKLHLQNKRQEEMLRNAVIKRNQRLFDSIFIIAEATKQGQCDLAEAAIRLAVLFDHVQGEWREEFATTYPSLADLNEVVKDLPRGDDRKQLAKRDRMRQDVERMKKEAELQDSILAELDILLAKKDTTLASLEAAL
uniref:DUF2489 domain-containing protein n=1 Tax=Thaumasiovibrio occultus TaxID=1891184 RepID=UPI000B34DED5|nr:DUF2489 domain-containing protein [Thaumasiovibrio occultus]